jgi:hypothetical protein
MATSEKSGKPKKVGRPKGSTKSAKSQPKTGAKKSGSKKKGGNFLGAVGDLVAPAGWGSFATAAALVGIDQADAAFRRGKGKAEKDVKSVKKMRGGDPDGVPPHPGHLLSNNIFYESKGAQPDYLDIFINQMKKGNNKYPTDYAKQRLKLYFNQLENPNKILAAQKKLRNTFPNGNKSLKISQVLESINK